MARKLPKGTVENKGTYRSKSDGKWSQNLLVWFGFRSSD